MGFETLPVDLGELAHVECNKSIPFEIKRVYYLYELPPGARRGGHAHRELWQIILAPTGSFDLVLDDGSATKRVSLNCPSTGLLVVPGIWRDIENFSKDAVCLVLASAKYLEEDYIRDYDEFVRTKK